MIIGVTALSHRFSATYLHVPNITTLGVYNRTCQHDTMRNDIRSWIYTTL